MFLPSGSYIIIGLEQLGYRLHADCREFSRRANQSISEETVMQIYVEVISQIMSIYDEDPNAFLINILSVPNFKTITYTENSIDLEVIQWFKGQVRIFAVGLYNQIARSVPNQVLKSFYSLEFATITMVGLKRYNANG